MTVRFSGHASCYWITPCAALTPKPSLLQSAQRTATMIDDVIARLGQLPASNRELDIEICVAIGKSRLDLGFQTAPHYTLSIDDALTLVPDGWKLVLWTENGLVEAYPIKGVKRPAGIKFRVQGHPLPIAICIAALKARQPHKPDVRTTEKL
jgi:hypothetical protein